MTQEAEKSSEELVEEANQCVIQGEYDSAAQLLTRALTELEKRYDETHPDVISIRDDLRTLEEMYSMKGFISEMEPDRVFDINRSAPAGHVGEENNSSEDDSS